MSKFEFNKEDINEATARNAFYNTSFSPERRGETVRLEYVDHMKRTFENLLQFAETEEQKQLLDDEMNRYKIGYISRLTDYLNAQSRCASSMITGPANFPVERNRKKMKASDNKYQELKEFSEKVIKSISKKLDNGRNVEQVRNDEFERLKNELDQYIKWNNYVQGYQVALFADKIKRSFANGNYEAVKMLLEYIKADQEKRNITHFSSRHSVWKLLEQTTIEKIEENKKTGEELINELSDIKIVNNHDDERVRIFFPGKPRQEVISLLKKSAWKWSPFNKAWQRKNTKEAIYSANRIIESIQKLEVA
jgi:hypothetical protein